MHPVYRRRRVEFSSPPVRISRFRFTRTNATVTVEEYLNTSYSPDRDYVDGQILERNWGEKEHSRLQFLLGLYLGTRKKQWGIAGFTEQREQVTPTRFRVPDLCGMIAPEPEEPIFTTPPFLCIEILSRDDRYGDVQDKIDDYLSFGVKYVWIIDPKTRKAYIYMHPEYRKQETEFSSARTRISGCRFTTSSVVSANWVDTTGNRSVENHSPAWTTGSEFIGVRII